MKWPLSEVMILMYVLLNYKYWSSKVYPHLTLIVTQLFIAVFIRIMSRCFQLMVKTLWFSHMIIKVMASYRSVCVSVSVCVCLCVVRVWCFSESLRGRRSASPPVICLNSLLLIRWQSNWPWLPCICVNAWIVWWTHLCACAA